MKFAASVILLLCLVAFCVVYVPLILFRHIPIAVSSYLENRDTLALLAGFLLVPALLGLFGLIALVAWVRISSWFMSRSDIESMIKQSVFGGGIGRFEKEILDKFY